MRKAWAASDVAYDPAAPKRSPIQLQLRQEDRKVLLGGLTYLECDGRDRRASRWALRIRVRRGSICVPGRRRLLNFTALVWISVGPLRLLGPFFFYRPSRLHGGIS